MHKHMDMIMNWIIRSLSSLLVSVWSFVRNGRWQPWTTIENVPLPVHSCSISNVTESEFTVTCKDGSTRSSSPSAMAKSSDGRPRVKGGERGQQQRQEEGATHHVMEIYDAFRESLVRTLTTTLPSISSSSPSITGQGTHENQSPSSIPSSPSSGPSMATTSPSSSSSPSIIFKASGLERNTTYILVIYSQNPRGKSSNVVTTVLTKSSNGRNGKTSLFPDSKSSNSVGSKAQNDEHTDYFQEHYYQGNILLGPSSDSGSKSIGKTSSDLSMIERIKGLKKSSASIFNRDIPPGNSSFFLQYFIKLFLTFRSLLRL